MGGVQHLLFAAQVAQDTPLKAGALAIGGAVGGAAGVFYKAMFEISHVSYGDASVIGGAFGVLFVVIYLLI